MDFNLLMSVPIVMIAAALLAAIPSSSCGNESSSRLKQRDALEAATWTRWNHVLTSSRTYDNPYADVIVSVTYNGPEGLTLRSYGFWDGGDTFRIRASFPQPGRWQWRTTCSDAGNAGLHDRSGVVEVTPYKGPHELYQHGFLRVSNNGRYLTYADGTPFFWLGDTAWAASARASGKDWKRYVDDRAAKGFSVIHLAPVPRAWMKTATDITNNPPFIGEGSTQWNPAYWQGFEQKVQYANERGLIVFIVRIMMGSAKDDPDPALARLFARNIAARLFGNCVVFSPAFDSDYSVVGLMREVGEELRQATSAHLITNHFGTSPVEENLHEAEWLDFDMFQSGHNAWWGDEQLYHLTSRAREMPLYLRQLAPPKPCVNGEAIYDGYAGNAHANAFRARQAGYLSLLSGACGYSFGMSGIWDWGAHDKKWNWSKSIASSSSCQMAHLGRLFRSLEWWQLESAPELILNQAEVAWERMVLAKSVRGDFALAYLPDNETIEVDMGNFPASMNARWYSPTLGEYTGDVSGVPNMGSHLFTRPGEGDWVLLLTGADE